MTGRRLAWIVAGLLGTITASTAMAVSGPRPPASPDVGPDGTASMHGDIASSDTSPLAGPGTGDVVVSARTFFAACPTILVRSDGRPLVLCTSMLGRVPVVRLLSRRSGKAMARIKLEAGSLLGGVYAFLDNQDRLVLVDGTQRLIRIKAGNRHSCWRSRWELAIDETADLSAAVTGHCGGGDCDAVVSLSAGAVGTVWFATQNAWVGVYDPASGAIHTTALASGERIDNSFSTTVDGRAAVVTNRALYLLQHDAMNAPQLVWRAAYDAGSARKPGNLSDGSGATPTFFGPVVGTEFVTITDNADDGISLIVRNADNGGLVCQQPIFGAGASGTEDSAIGIGSSVIVASTYGYLCPTVPEGAGPAVPEKAGLVGGMVRVDVLDTQDGCRIVWANKVRSAAVPKLSTADQLIYTVERRSPLGSNRTGPLDRYDFTVIDSDTGAVMRRSEIGSGVLADSLQMAGNPGLHGVYWQGTLGGVVRIAPDAE